MRKTSSSRSRPEICRAFYLAHLGVLCCTRRTENEYFGRDSLITNGEKSDWERLYLWKKVSFKFFDALDLSSCLHHIWTF